MDLSQYVTQLREDLASAAAAGDEQTRRTAALLGAAIEPAARLAMMNALADLAAEVTAALGDRVVEVRLDGRDVRVAVSAADDDAASRSPSRAARRRLRAAVSRASAAGRRGRHQPDHAAAGRADQGPGRAGRRRPGHVAELLGGAGRAGRAAGGRQASTGNGRGDDGTAGTAGTASACAAGCRDERDDGLHQGRPDGGSDDGPTRAGAPRELAGGRRRRAGAVGRRRRASRCTSTGPTRPEVQVEVRHDPSRGRHVEPGHQRGAQLARPGDGRAGRRARRPRRRGRAGRRDHLVGARAAADRALVAGAAAAGGAARGHRDGARRAPGWPPARARATSA